jgi:flagellin
MIDSEFQAMAEEINRIARATDFNGVKLLDGSLSGPHNGSGLAPSGAVKVHFGSGNDSAEDYYYIGMNDATIRGLGLARPGEGVQSLGNRLVNGAAQAWFASGVISFAIIPAGTKDLIIHMYDNGANDTIQLFTRDGKHLAGTTMGHSNDWVSAGVTTLADMQSEVLTEANAFLPGAIYDPSLLNGSGTDVITFTVGSAGPPFSSYNSMNIGYSGDEHAIDWNEYLTIDDVTDDLVLLVVGSGAFYIDATWTTMGTSAGYQPGSGEAISIQTQELAQQALDKINEGVLRKDRIRANLGAMQNRLENTVSNLQIQAENIQAAESRISDVDVATEMTELVRAQILSQSAVAMLSQANNLPRMALSLLTG